MDEQLKAAMTHWTQLGQEPDYRFTLANERTFLAWIRTALAIMAAGFVVAQFAAHTSSREGAMVLAMGLLMAATAISIGAFFRWRRNQLAMRLARPLGHGTMPMLLALAMGAGSLAVLIAFALSR